MSNESNRDTRTVSPGELKASDFFPPGTGWNQDEGCTKPPMPRKPHQDVQDEIAEDGRRQH